MLRSAYRAARAGLRRLRREEPRALFWSVYDPPNFGEWIGPYLFERISGVAPRWAKPSRLSSTTVTMTVGSIAELIRDNAVVWGSGLLARDNVFDRPHRVTAVRGPFTRARFDELGYPCPEVYGDPAILLPRFYRPVDDRPSVRLGIAPHFRDLDDIRERVAGVADVRVIDVTRPVEEVVDAIATCERVVASSLHGLIVAHAYGVPAAWARFSDRLGGDGVKFEDYFAAGGIDAPEPLDRPGSLDPADLWEAAGGAPVPDLVSLHDPLLAACPFPGAGS